MTVAPPKQAHRPRILIVGGIDGHLRLDTYRQLMLRGYDVAVVAPSKLPSVEDIGCEVFIYRLARGVSLKDDLVAINDLRRIVLDWQPDIVHAFDTKPNYLVPIALRKFKHISIVRTINGLGRIFSSNGLKNQILRGIFFSLHRIARPYVTRSVFQNEHDRQLFLRRGLVSSYNAILVPGSGIDTVSLRAFLNPEARVCLRRELGWSNRTVYLLVARLLVEKGVPEFIAAAKLLRKSRPDSLCVLVGPAGGAEFGAISLESLREHKDDILYLGERRDVPALLNASDIFVLPTKYREGIPRALLEAMAMGRPVIVSDMPGCADVVLDAGCGMVVPAGDADLLARAMDKICNADLVSMGRAGALSVDERYAQGPIMDALYRLYNNVHGSH